MHTRASSGLEWFSSDNGFVDLEFDNTYDFSRLAIWNEEGGNGVGTITVFTSPDATYTNLTQVAVLSPAQNASGQDYPAEVFDLNNATAQYLRLDFIGNEGPIFGVGEIAFAGTVVPEPASASLMGICLLLINFSRRR